MIRIIFFLILSFPLFTYSLDLKNYGAVFPVTEIDLKELIYSKLKLLEDKQELKKHQRLINLQIKKNILHPKNLNLFPTLTPKTYYVDPSLIIQQDILSANGNILAHRGEKINPFSYVNYHKILVFFDGDDPSQVSWVLKKSFSSLNYKLILTGGNIKVLSEKLNRIYFDQNKFLATKFKLEHVPAIVKQVNLKWQIQECNINV